MTRDWTHDAVRLTGESDFVRATALQNLRRIPDLSNVLLREVRGPRQALALDAITALKIHSLLPNLLQLAERDDSGQLCLTIDSLVTEKTLSLVAKIYRERLFCKDHCQAAEPARLVMLEALGRMGEELPTQLLSKVFAQSSYEVKSAVLRYIRGRLVVAPAADRIKTTERYLPIVLAALNTQPYQIRLQSIYLVREFNLESRALSLSFICSTDPRPEIRAFCRSSLRVVK